jgi:hypothetical protein
LRQPLPINSPARTLALACLLFLFSIAEKVPALSAPSPLQVKQGEIISLTLPLKDPVDSAVGKFLNQEIHFYKTTDEKYTALLGIDLDQAPGTHPLEVTWKRGEATGTEPYLIEVLTASFGTENLKLPKGMVDLDPPTLARVEKEQRQQKKVFEVSIPRKLWDGGFLRPVEGKVAGTFGLRRIMNGQPRNPHTGEDITAPAGTPVVASNAGKVVLVGDFYFNGHSVVIDHGLGLFSMYFHLLSATVKEGETVKKGDPVGLVGQSGRATGPHLHWGMRLNGARVNPFSLVEKNAN